MGTSDPFSEPMNIVRRLKHSLPDLPYDYNALEPIISAEIMNLHHKKHHNAYITNLNIGLEKLDSAIQNKDIQAEVSAGKIINFNGGGHVNHSLFWENLIPVKEFSEPTGTLLKYIQKEFNDFESFKSKFNLAAVGVQGSGWGWLGYNKAHDRVEIATTASQDLLSLQNLVPLMGVDVWEHAYYLQYKNVRPDYLNAIWQVINWKTVSRRLEDAKVSK